MEGVRGEKATPGVMRTKQNWIGKPNCTLMDATYIPPPVQEMKECFSDLEKYIHSKPKEPTLIQCALVHYQFEAIHPFVDGNGRIGRLLIAFMLIERGGLSQPLLYLSDFFEQHRNTYYDLLLNVSQKGEWKSWLKFFLEGVCEQSEDSLETVQKLLTLKDEYTRIAREPKVPKAVNPLIEVLFGKPIVSISELVKTWNSSFPTVKRAVDYLIKKGILTEMTGKQRNRLYAANEVLDAIMTERTESFNIKQK